MTSQEVKEYLMQYRDVVRQASAAQDHLTELKAMAERITPNYGGCGSGNAQIGDRLGEAVAKIVDAEAKLDAEIELLIATEREIERAIKSVEEPYRTLLYERYINGKTWEQLAVDMHYSYRGITKMHGRALIVIKECIEVPT